MELLLGQCGSREVLVRLAGKLWGMAELPEMGRLPGGKPCFPDHPQCQFNLSHSGGLVLCGGGCAPLGVDLEEVRPRRAGLARYICSPEE